MAFHGDLSGITSKNKPNATYQSMIDGELLYEYAIHRYNRNKTRATFRCAGCRAVYLESKTVIFDESSCFLRLSRKTSFVAGIVFVKEKDTVAYERLFQKLKDLVGDDIGPKEFGFDHELAAINAAKAILAHPPELNPRTIYGFIY
uniref:Uncharacterized protein n=1 Tax=Panagrolaimus davidi TaxID=227884 RepID=A0A914QRW4_9BILA